MSSNPQIRCDCCSEQISIRQDGGPNLGQVEIRLLDWAHPVLKTNPMNNVEYKSAKTTTLNGDFCTACFSKIETKMNQLIKEVNEECHSLKKQS